MAAYDKSTTTPSFFKTKFLSDILPKYKDYNQIYSDGSKSDDSAAYGIYSNNLGTRSKRLGNDSSIFTAEMKAIKNILMSIRNNPHLKKKYVIFCDSKSVLDSIHNQESRNPIMIDILDILQNLNRQKFDIKFCWIPSHVGIRGNEQADQLARNGLRGTEPSQYKIPYKDYIPFVKTHIKNQWQKRWDYKHNEERIIKLHYILPTIKPYYVNNLNRKDEKIIHRLRIGHTRLTHRFLMEDPLKREPVCNFCYLDDLTVHHILIECQHFAVIRARYYSSTSLKDLFERYSFKHIIEFLKQAGLYNLI